MAEIGKLIRGARKDKGMSQKELARRAQISVNALCAIESGKSFPSPTTLDKICSCLGVQAVFLLVDKTINLTKIIVAFEELSSAISGVRVVQTRLNKQYDHRETTT